MRLGSMTRYMMKNVLHILCYMGSGGFAAYNAYLDGRKFSESQRAYIDRIDDSECSLIIALNNQTKMILNEINGLREVCHASEHIE